MAQVLDLPTHIQATNPGDTIAKAFEGLAQRKIQLVNERHERTQRLLEAMEQSLIQQQARKEAHQQKLQEMAFQQLLQEAAYKKAFEQKRIVEQQVYAHQRAKVIDCSVAVICVLVILIVAIIGFKRMKVCKCTSCRKH